MKSRLNGLLAFLLATIAASSSAAVVHDQGSWETTLLPRDIDGNGTTDAFYDIELRVTWLRASSTYKMNKIESKNWAETSNFFGLTGWRLPTTPDFSCDWSLGGTSCGYSPGSLEDKRSEMAHLFFQSLGNKGYYGVGGPGQPGWGLTNTGDFEGLKPTVYWSGTEFATNTSIAWDFGTGGAFQTNFDHLYNLYALAVRPGDVSAVPEPKTYALILCGLGAIGIAARRRKHQQIDR